MQRFKKILVYVGPQDPVTATKQAYEVATANNASVTLMGVVKPLPSAIGMMTDVASADELEKLLMQDRREQLFKLAEDFSNAGLKVDVLVTCGDPAQEICKRVLIAEHDLVIKTADGMSTTGKLFGSISRSLLRICPCPVWTLKPQTHGAFDQVLAAVDVNADDATHIHLNDQILDLAYSIAVRDNAKLHVVCVWDMWMEQALRRRAGDAEVNAALIKREAQVRKELDRLLQVPLANSADVQIHLHRGKASRNILAVAEDVEADLIVMGTVCRTGVAGFLIGNTAENLLANVTCSVLAVKPQGFQSPVQISADDQAVQPQPLPMV